MRPPVAAGGEGPYVVDSEGNWSLDVAFAEKLWTALEEALTEGENEIRNLVKKTSQLVGSKTSEDLMLDLYRAQGANFTASRLLTLTK